MNRRTATSFIAVTAIAGLATLAIAAPDYLPTRGFPLDDAWIHAVYARALARTGTLSYNPGIPATGVTSPLWTLVFAVPHLVGSTPGTVVILAKLLGFCLHVATALLIYAALAGSPRSVGPRRAGPPLAGPPLAGPLAGACLVAFHPDLLSAAVSGMEVPLAALTVCLLLYAARRPRFLSYAGLCVLAPFARPELAVLCFTIPFALFLFRDRTRLQTTAAAAFVGTGASFGLLAMRNVSVSGLPLPATFYAKVGHADYPLLKAQVLGFSRLLDHIAITDSSMLLAALIGLATLLLVSREAAPEHAAAAAAFANGILFCALSFVLVAPVDPEAFYHQRYILPALPLIIGSVPVLADLLLERWVAPPYVTVARGVLLALLAVSVIIEAPTRYRRLANDARNIDDVQVAIGSALAAQPASDVMWATDAGAIRYFGNPFVVDLMGLNTPAMLAEPQAVLDAHRPRYIEIVGGWLSLDEESARRLEATQYVPSTPYTVTSFAPMSSQLLARCPPDLVSGRMSIRLGTFHFGCAP